MTGHTAACFLASLDNNVSACESRMCCGSNLSKGGVEGGLCNDRRGRSNIGAVRIGVHDGHGAVAGHADDYDTVLRLNARVDGRRRGCRGMDADY
jgi:hypothetical protein